MKKILLVLKNEFITVVTRASFLITLFLLPVGGFVVMLVVGALSGGNQESAASIVTGIFSSGTPQAAEGFVDPGGWIKNIPPGYDGQLVQFPDEAAAQAALAKGSISGFYLISPTYLQDGKITNVRPDFNPLGGSSQTYLITQALDYNLIQGDANLAARIQFPANLQITNLEQKPTRDSGGMLTFFLPYTVCFLFYIVIMSSASLMLSSVTNEKQNRVIEILMTSMTPTEMLTGKIIALGAAGLLQTLVWSGTGYVLLLISGQTFNLSSAFQLPVTILLWGAVYFLGGFAVYASLMAAVGALVPNLREASQATFIMIIPLIIPLMFITALIQSPDGILSLVLSLFPLTSPIAMMTRLAGGAVPLWQLGISVVLLAATAWLVIRAAAGMFRAQNLLSGQTFSLKLLARALVGKA